MISLESVTKTFANGYRAVDGLSLDIADGETLVWLGTSGSGKTTVLKLINRLVEPTAGRIRIDGQDIHGLDPVHLRRRIGYVVQEVGLFPHMTVAANIAVVPRLLGWPARRIDALTDEWLERVGLVAADCRDRYPGQLSGGQRQRVGVARALVADPPILLMDEPFGALDPITRAQLQDEFAELQERLRKTVVLVTHDIFEAVRLADRIALLDRGRLQQVGTPAEIIERPANDFVDQFLGRHRFHLRLLTRTIRSLAGAIQPAVGLPPAGGLPPACDPPPVDEPTEHLHLHYTILQALDCFRRTGRSTLPVYEATGAGEQRRGWLDKRVLLDVMIGIIDEGRA